MNSLKKGVYVLLKVCCISLLSPATKKIIPNYIKEFVKQLLKNTMQTTKNLLTFQPIKTKSNFLQNFEPLKQNSLTQNYHNKSKGDTGSKISFPEDVTCA